MRLFWLEQLSWQERLPFWPEWLSWQELLLFWQERLSLQVLRPSWLEQLSSLEQRLFLPVLRRFSQELLSWPGRPFSQELFLQLPWLFSF